MRLNLILPDGVVVCCAVKQPRDQNMNTEYRHYFDWNGKTFELTDAYLVRKEYRKAMLENLPGLKPLSIGGQVWVGIDSEGFEAPVTRKIQYKRNPSLHECSARCRGGKCNGVCECKCGGKNHGIGR